MHSILFRNQSALSREDMERYATRLQLDVERSKRELKQQTHAARVRQDLIAGVQNGVNGTPGLFLNGVRQQGSFDAPKRFRKVRSDLRGAGLPRNSCRTGRPASKTRR